MQTTPKCSGRMLGTFWATCTGVSLTLVGVLLKYLPQYNVAELVIYQYISSTIFALPLAIPVWKLPYTIKYFLLMLGLSVFGLAGNVSRFGALQNLPLGDANAILFNTPIAVAILARIILKENITRLTILSLFVSLIGLALTVKLPLILSSEDFASTIKNKDHLIGCGYAFIGLFCTAATTILFRKVTNVKSVVNMVVRGLMGVPIAVSFIPAFGSFKGPQCSTSSLVLMAFCLFMFASLVTGLRAAQLMEATLVSMTIRSTDILLSFIAQIAIFNEAIDIYSGLGATLVVVTGLSVPLQNWMQSLPDDSPWKFAWWLK